MTGSVPNCYKYKANGTRKKIHNKIPNLIKKNHKTILHPKTAGNPARSGRLADWGIQREKWGKPDVDIPHGKKNCASVSFLSIPVGELMSFETWNKKTTVELQKRWMDQEHV
jgi:hypothetical protein